MASGTSDYYNPYDQLADVIAALIGATSPHTFVAYSLTMGVVTKILDTWTERAGCIISSIVVPAGTILIGVSNSLASNLYTVKISAGSHFLLERYRGEVYALAPADLGQQVYVTEW